MILHQINPNRTTACGHVSVQHECLFSCKFFKRGVGLFWGTCSSVVNPNLKVMPDISCWCLQEDPHCPSMFWNHARLLAHKHTRARTCSCIITSIIKDYPPDLFIFRCPWHKPQEDDLWPPPTTKPVHQSAISLSETYESNLHFILLSAAGLLSLAGAHSPAEPGLLWLRTRLLLIHQSKGGKKIKHTGLFVLTSKTQTEQPKWFVLVVQ